jgi:hypothetical protein
MKIFVVTDEEKKCYFICVLFPTDELVYCKAINYTYNLYFNYLYNIYLTVNVSILKNVGKAFNARYFQINWPALNLSFYIFIAI